MRKIIIAKKTEYAFEKSEIAMFLFGILVVGYVAVRVLIG